MGVTKMWPRLCAVTVCGFFLGSGSTLAAGTVKGTGRYERIKGRPGNYVELYEWNLYLSPDAGFTLGERRRLGACQEYGSACTPGYYQIDSPAGWYTILVTQPIFYARPTVVTDVQLIDGQMVTVNPDLNPDYSCYHVADGAWSWSTTWYQTFIATGTSITRVQFMLAGSNASSIRISVHRDNGGVITSWPQVGPAKSAAAGTGDGWVGYRSGDVPTTPYERYAIKLTGEGGTPPYDFGIRSRVEDGNGYALGQAYDAAGNPRNLDLLVTVFSDNDGTVIPYIDMTPGNVEDLAGGTGVWGQTFRATSVALAAADCFIAGSGTWDLDVVFRIRQNGPGGTQVGPTKTAQSTYQAANTGIVGVSYAPGEVPLTPGSTYFIEMSPAAGSPAFAAYKFHSQADNGYPYGSAYKDGVPQSGVDLEMTIMEYKPWYSPAMLNPGFEDHGGTLDDWRITLLDGKGPDKPPHDNTNPYGPRTPFGDHFAGKITSWQSMDFTMGQIVEVSNYDPAAERVVCSLSAYVQLHGHTGLTEEPLNVRQLWEIGWNDDGSAPGSVNRCDHYRTIASIDGTYTGNDRINFYPLTAVSEISDVIGLKYVALRVRFYNGAPHEWSMSNIDNVSFVAAVPPPSPKLLVEPTTIDRVLWIGEPAAPDVFTVTNAGPGSLAYEITDDASWLEVSPTSGSSTGESDPITVTYNLAGLPAAERTATITVVSQDAWNSPQTISVTFTTWTVGPDFDRDGDVDQFDFGTFQRCLSGAGVVQQDPLCQPALLDPDEDVDSDDLNIFVRCLSGPGLFAEPTCDD
ncbi:MAG: BACON domain-containing protein [Phycisphaerae bacterium]